jgi:hypothetical protein
MGSSHLARLRTQLLLPILLAASVEARAQGRVPAHVGEGHLPRWSPSGEWIAFLRDFTSGGYGAVWLMRPDGSEAHAVTNPGVYYTDGLDWSPDGEWLAGFGGTGISLVQISTGLLLPIAQLNNYHTPAWRP